MLISKNKASVFDIGLLIMHCSQTMLLRHHKTDHLGETYVEDILFLSQAFSFVILGGKLFDEDFYIDKDGYIYQPEFRKSIMRKKRDDIWGDDLKGFAPDSYYIRNYVSLKPGVTKEQNDLVLEVTNALLSRTEDEVENIVRNSKPYINALKNPERKVSKSDIKNWACELYDHCFNTGTIDRDSLLSGLMISQGVFDA